MEEIKDHEVQPSIRILDAAEVVDSFSPIRGNSHVMMALKDKARQFAASDHQVLIMGENGTGKDLLAQAIHAASNRRVNNFITVNCAAIPGELLESELFGYESGAFTGAREKGKQGQFELAEGGTIFLDEIGDIPFSLQAKLLRVLENHEIQKLGSQKRFRVDFRLLLVTNRNLEKLVREGTFREDLYYRLNLFELVIPPLRQRLEDIPILEENILDSLRSREGCLRAHVSQEVLDAFHAYPWRGNVRELRNILTYAVYSMKETETELTLKHLPDRFFRRDEYEQELQKRTLVSAHLDGHDNFGEGIVHEVSDYMEMVRGARSQVERKAVLETLAQSGGNKAKAARLLGISRSNLYKKISLLDIQ